MKNSILLLVFCLSANLAFSQSSTDETIKEYFDDENFSAIIEFIKSNGDADLNNESNYYIGLSYFDNDNYSNAIEYLAKVATNDPEHYASRYYSGISYFKIQDYENAFRLLDECAELSGRVFCLEEKAEMLIELDRKDEAFNILNDIYNAERKMNARGYIMFADLLVAENDFVKCIDVLETGKINLNDDDLLYYVVLYKLGFEYNRQKNYKSSNDNLLEIYKEIPNLKSIFPIIIQNYFSQNDFISGMTFRGQLYTDFENGVLEESLGNRFMFDEFDWKDKLVRGFERFDPPDEDREYPFYKHIFYIINQDDEVDFTIQTELFFGRDMVEFDYVLGRSENIDDDYYHETYTMLNFNEPVLDYEKLRNSVLKILNKEVKPVTSSRRKINK